MKQSLLVGALFVGFGVASAAPVCVTATYDVYTAAGFECEISGVVFNNFSYPATPNGGDLDEEDITVIPLSGLGTVGLRFAGDFSATGTFDGAGNSQGQVAEQYRFFYDVTVPGGLITDIAAAVNGGSLFSPNAQKPSGYLGSLVAANDGAGAFVLNSTPGQSDMTALNTARPTVNADAFVQVLGGASTSASAGPFGVGALASLDNVYTFEIVVPEPGTALLLLAGLAAMAGGRRMLRR